jgi:hypothetical protein
LPFASVYRPEQPDAGSRTNTIEGEDFDAADKEEIESYFEGLESIYPGGDGERIVRPLWQFGH